MTGLAHELKVKRSRRDPVSQGFLKVLGLPPVAWVLARTLRHLDFLVLRLSGRRITVSDVFLPTLFLTTTGARSGQPRTSQLVAVPLESGELAVIGSNFGQDKHPAWVHNVLATPLAMVTFKRRTVPVRVREVTGDGADEIWAAGIATYPSFGSYRLATDRPIKVFLIERAE